MYYEMSYGLNVEMHKQTEIAKRLNAIIAQILPFLSAEHQQQVAAAVDRAKQVTMTELNAIIGQQMHSQQMPPHPHGHPPFMPHAAAMAAAAGLGQNPGMPPASAAGLLALSASMSGSGGVPPHLPPVSVANSTSSTPAGKDGHFKQENEKRSSSVHSADDRHRNSFSPSHLDARDIDRHRSRSPVENENKINNKKRRENNNNNNDKHNNDHHGSEDERSDADLVVDVANEVSYSLSLMTLLVSRCNSSTNCLNYLYS
jgi:groucho